MADHPDFQALPWVRKLLADPNITIKHEKPKKSEGNMAPNRMFVKLLYKPGAINAHVKFWRPSREPDSIRKEEECYLLSLGPDIDGKSGRAHGGMSGMILDQICGSVANITLPTSDPPATATLTVDYKAPISTPGVILARGWATEVTGRKVWVRSVLQDGDGKVLAAGKALFVVPRQASL